MVTESHEYTCSNPSCGKVFANPVKARNLAFDKAKPYEACPYCLTEIVLEEPPAPIEEKEDLEVREAERKSMGTHLHEERPAPALAKVQKCAYHFGYLSKRSTKEKIPEDCIVCVNIVKCMLREVTG